MISFSAHTKVYLAVGPTDMRRAINGLSAQVEDVLEKDVFSSHLFVFCNRGRDKVKLLFWHNNGFWLWYRRLERQRFWWPMGATDETTVEVSVRELSWLLEGLDITRIEAHKGAKYSLS